MARCAFSPARLCGSLSIGRRRRAWTATGASFSHVLDSDLELVLATRDRYPGQGLLATSEMVPGQRWVDRYVVWLDETTFAPSRALLEVGLYDLTTGERPPILVEQGHGRGGRQCTAFPAAAHRAPARRSAQPAFLSDGEQDGLGGLGRRATGGGCR